MTCSTCRWWDREGMGARAQDSERGRCMGTLPIPKGMAATPHTDFREAVWPETLPTDGARCRFYDRDALTRQEAAEHVQAERAELPTPEAMNPLPDRNQEL